jgi:hypothetical protein
MKNYKVEAIMKFTDKTENGIKRNVGDIFETTKERYEFLKQNNAVKLIEIIEEKKEEVLEDPYKDFEVKEEKPKNKKKKTNKK